MWLCSHISNNDVPCNDLEDSINARNTNGMSFMILYYL